MVCSIQLLPGLPKQAALDFQVMCAAVRPAEKVEQVVQGCQRSVDGGGRVPAPPQRIFPIQNDTFCDGPTVQIAEKIAYTPQIFFHRCLRPLHLKKRRGKREDLFVCEAMSVHGNYP